MDLLFLYTFSGFIQLNTLWRSLCLLSLLLLLRAVHTDDVISTHNKLIYVVTRVVASFPAAGVLHSVTSSSTSQRERISVVFPLPYEPKSINVRGSSSFQPPFSSIAGREESSISSNGFEVRQPLKSSGFVLTCHLGRPSNFFWKVYQTSAK